MSRTRPLGSRSPPKGFSDSYSKSASNSNINIVPDTNEDDNLPILEPTNSWSNNGNIPRVNHLPEPKSIPKPSFRVTESSHSPPRTNLHMQVDSKPHFPIRELSPNTLPQQKSGSDLFRDSRASSLFQHKETPISICFICNNRLKSTQDVVRTDYGSIHVQCFACSRCKTSLVHSEFYYSAETEKLYCHLDYHQKFSPRCGLCKTPIENKGIFALGKHWHSDHFFCHECSNPISSSKSYFVLGENTMCEECHNKKIAIKCWKCQHPCGKDEEVIETLGRQWCAKCFSCEECNTPFPGYEFILREDGTLVCQQCEYLKLKADSWN